MRRPLRSPVLLALLAGGLAGDVGAAPPGAPLAAFPGAEGGGSLARGGRGGRVVGVTHLGDAGPGSLRACVEASGPRLCVFRTGGTIALRSPLRVSSPYLTIAGETAPGDGIQLDGREGRGDVLRIESHDVIVTGLKLRPGFNGDREGNGVAAVSGDAVHDVIFDHDTIQWSNNKAIGLWGLRGAPHSVTVSYCIIAETLSAHSVNILTGSDNGDVSGDRFAAGQYANRMTDIDFHHNFILNASHRNPLLKHRSSRFVNNVVFNWSFYAMELGGGISADVIGNVFRRGPLFQEGHTLPHEILAFPATARNRTTAIGAPSVYLALNLGPNAPDLATDNIRMTRLTDTGSRAGGENGAETGVDLSAYRRTAPLPPSPPGARPITVVTPGPADLTCRDGPLGRTLFPSVGATRRLACGGGFVRRVDAQEERLLASYPDGGAQRLVRHEAAVGGYPVLAPGAPCPDRDGDGLPDAYEEARELDPGDPRDAAQVQSDGYTNLERYLAGR